MRLNPTNLAEFLSGKKPEVFLNASLIASISAARERHGDTGGKRFGFC